MPHSIDITDYNAFPLITPLDKVTDWLRDVNADEVPIVEQLIVAATEQSENIARQDFLERTYKIVLDAFTTTVVLDKFPCGDIVSVVAKVATVNTTLANTKYYKSEQKWGTELVFTETITVDAVYDALVITYKTKPSPRYVPLAIAAVKLTVAKWFDNRASGKQEYPETAEVMMLGIRIRGV
jgi:hypothetical protein